MVKNTTGGKGHKKFANKPVVKSTNIQIASSSNEFYAIATKMLGGAFNAIDTFGVKWNIPIRGRFSGRNRKDNRIEIGTWVLIGDNGLNMNTSNRDSGKSGQLLYVYDSKDKDWLMNKVVASWSVLINNDVTSKSESALEQTNDVHFMTSKEEEQELIIQQIEEAKVKGNKVLTLLDSGFDDFNIDDI